MDSRWNVLVAALVVLGAAGCKKDSSGPGSQGGIPGGFYGTFYVNGVAAYTTWGGYVCNYTDPGDPSPSFEFRGVGAGSTPLTLGVFLYEDELVPGQVPDPFVWAELDSVNLNGTYDDSVRVVSWDGTRAQLTFWYRSLTPGGVYELRDGRLNLAKPTSHTPCY